MRLLLRYELKRNYHFQVHPQALESILHSLEWQTWIQKSTGEALFTFSPTGAMAVITVLDRIPLECSLPLVNVNHKDDNDNRDGDDSFKLNLVQEGRFQVLSCPSHVNLDGKKEECKQLCHFVM